MIRSRWVAPGSLVAALVLFPGAGEAQSPSEVGPLVTTEWLEAHLGSGDVVVLHAETRRERYEEEHIPGAAFLDMSGFVWEGEPPVGTEMREPPSIREALEAAGARNDARLVVYSANALIAARAWMTMDVVGLGENSSLLDGGLGAWREEGRPVESGGVEIETGEITLTPRDDVVVGAEWIAQRLDEPELALVDARPDDEYTGADGGMNGMANPGHIPGAHQLYWEEMVESREVPRLLDQERLEELFRGAGAAPGDTVVPYCMVGYRASLTYFVARMLGYETRFYDGSWRDWGTRDLPFVSGSDPR
jgi:thiosulfate/3-mercaptopyruvate sulfurtransferase